jgi:hypothetical protein
MDAIAGCRHCGHTEKTDPDAATGKRVGRCPRCGSLLRALGPLGSRLLAVGSAPTKPWDRSGRQYVRWGSGGR